MKVKYHINPETMRPNICRAKRPEACPYYDEETGTPAPHFDDKPTARKYVEKVMSEEEGDLKTLQREEKINYSFMKKFEELEEEFEEFPKKFMNNDLRRSGKQILLYPEEKEEKVEDVMKVLGEDFPELTDYDVLRDATLRKFTTRRAVSRQIPSLITAITTPKEAEVPEEELEKVIEELGVYDVQRFEDSGVSPKFGTVYTGKIDYLHEGNGKTETKTLFISEGSVGNHVMSNRYFRNPNIQKELGLKGYSTWLDRRSVVGLGKINRHSEINPLHPTATPHLRFEKIVRRLEEKQERGREFEQQKKHVHSTRGTIATAFTDKKHPDKTRQKMMKETRLNSVFRQVEIDNDVDPKEFKDFEDDYFDVLPYLPKVKEGFEPTLRIRKLGKHSSQSFKVHGLFSALDNTIAIDLREGGTSSLIHESFHHWDLISKGSVSLSDEFRELSKSYSNSIKIPTQLESKRDYYMTPTEQLARMGEVYIHHKAKMENKLINPEKFEGFDYAPIFENHTLKRQIYEFFDKHLES